MALYTLILSTIFLQIEIQHILDRLTHLFCRLVFYYVKLGSFDDLAFALEFSHVWTWTRYDNSLEIFAKTNSSQVDPKTAKPQLHALVFLQTLKHVNIVDEEENLLVFGGVQVCVQKIGHHLFRFKECLHVSLANLVIPKIYIVNYVTFLP